MSAGESRFTPNVAVFYPVSTKVGVCAAMCAKNSSLPPLRFPKDLPAAAWTMCRYIRYNNAGQPELWNLPMVPRFHLGR